MRWKQSNEIYSNPKAKKANKKGLYRNTLSSGTGFVQATEQEVTIQKELDWLKSYQNMVIERMKEEKTKFG